MQHVLYLVFYFYFLYFFLVNILSYLMVKEIFGVFFCFLFFFCFSISCCIQTKKLCSLCQISFCSKDEMNHFLSSLVKNFTHFLQALVQNLGKRRKIFVDLCYMFKSTS
jgi:hypothetical protein